MKKEYKVTFPPNNIIPPIGSFWKSGSGSMYKVLHITNEENTEYFPLTVVYEGENKKMLSCELKYWPIGMTFVSSTDQISVSFNKVGKSW